VRIGVEIFLEPVAGLEVEMLVGSSSSRRLGCPEEAWQGVRLPAAGKGLGLTIEVAVTEPKPLKDRRGFQPMV
jgi:hypothetical protein